MKKLIKVTKKHIEDGWPGRPYSCPIALALRGLGYPNPHVGERSFNLGQGQGWKDLPRSAIQFIDRFDNQKKVKPFNFYVNV